MEKNRKNIFSKSHFKFKYAVHLAKTERVPPWFFVVVDIVLYFVLFLITINCVGL